MLILAIPILLGLRTFLYWGAFRLRRCEVTFWTALLIAGGPLAVGFVLPYLPFNVILDIFIAIGVAVYLSMKYGSVPFFPDAVVTVLLVEIGTFLAIWFLGDRILHA